MGLDCSDEMALQLVHPGQWLGDGPIATGRPYRVSALARTDCDLATVPYARLSAMLQQHPEWRQSIADLNEYWFDVSACATLDLMIADATARCVAVLMRLAGFRPHRENTGSSRVVPLSQSELARNAGLERKFVGRTLCSLESDGLIKTGYRTIELTDTAALYARAGNRPT